MNYPQIYDQTQQCLTIIRKELKVVHRMCENTSTIERSNELFKKYLQQAKDKAFKAIEGSLVKPYVIYQVNKYYYSLIKQ